MPEIEAYELTEDEAVVMARALVYFSRYLQEEYEKIARSGPEVSELIKSAAVAQYQELSEPVTKLHMDLAEHFPKLRQP